MPSHSHSTKNLTRSNEKLCDWIFCFYTSGFYKDYQRCEERQEKTGKREEISESGNEVSDLFSPVLARRKLYFILLESEIVLIEIIDHNLPVNRKFGFKIIKRHG